MYWVLVMRNIKEPKAVLLAKYMKRNRNVKILNQPTTHKNKIGDLVSHIRHSVLMDTLASAPS